MDQLLVDVMAVDRLDEVFNLTYEENFFKINLFFFIFAQTFIIRDQT